MIYLLFVMILSLSVNHYSQPKSVHFKKLIEYLPSSELKGFIKSKPTGNTQSVMNISSSEAEATFNEQSGSETETSKSITVKIVDATFNPYLEMQFTMLGENFESETESGYEKFTRINGKFPGKITVNSGDFRYCVIEFSVASKYLVSLRGDGFDDIKLLNDIIKTMDLEGLSKLKAEN